MDKDEPKPMGGSPDLWKQIRQAAESIRARRRELADGFKMVDLSMSKLRKSAQDQPEGWAGYDPLSEMPAQPSRAFLRAIENVESITQEALDSRSWVNYLKTMLEKKP